MTELIIKKEEGGKIEAQMVVESRQGDTIFFYLPIAEGGVHLHVKDVDALIDFLRYQTHQRNEY